MSRWFLSQSTRVMLGQMLLPYKQDQSLLIGSNKWWYIYIYIWTYIYKHIHKICLHKKLSFMVLFTWSLWYTIYEYSLLWLKTVLIHPKRWTTAEDVTHDESCSTLLILLKCYSLNHHGFTLSQYSPFTFAWELRHVCWFAGSSLTIYVFKIFKIFCVGSIEISLIKPFILHT